MRNAQFKVRDCMRMLRFEVRDCMKKVRFEALSQGLGTNFLTNKKFFIGNDCLCTFKENYEDFFSLGGYL